VTRPALDTVVFDLGGVLADWDPRYLYRQLFDSDEAAMERFLAEVCTPSWNHAMDAGRPREEAVAELVDVHPGQAGLIRAWVDRWEEMLGEEIAGTAQLVGELDRQGVRLLALTNWSAETFPVARTRFASFATFEAIVVSGEHGIAKPDPALYRILVDRHGVDPAAAAYVDDRPDNVAIAAGLGFTGLVFTDPDLLRRDLVALGLLDPPGRIGSSARDADEADEGDTSGHPADPAVR
jgi:2-haloacid dehalogenase